MRFMILVKADKNSEADVLPDEKLLTEMGKYNEELVKAGVLLAGEGLHASAKGARVKVKSKEEAIEWVKRVPFEDGEIEIRQVFEASDFGEALTPELKKAEDRLRAQVAAKKSH